MITTNNTHVFFMMSKFLSVLTFKIGRESSLMDPILSSYSCAVLFFPSAPCRVFS